MYTHRQCVGSVWEVCGKCVGYLSEKLQEVVHISGSHGLSDVSLLLKVVFAGVRGIDLLAIQ